MELLNTEETLYRISVEQELTANQIIDYKYNLLLKSSIPIDWINRKFADFENTSIKLVSEKLKEWNFNIPNIAGIISVQNGIGKTHLATCVYKKFLYEQTKKTFDSVKDRNLTEWVFAEHTNNSLFLSEKKLSLIIQESFNDKRKSQLEILEYYCNLDFLVIDDCFSMKQNDFARQNIFYIVDERREWNNKPTFITSNLSLQEIADIDTRIADRLRSELFFQIKEKSESFRKI